MPKRTVAERMEALGRVALFEGLPQATLRKILPLATEAEVPAGWVLVEARREASGMFIIEEGTALVEADGRRFELGPGDVVGEMALLTPEAVRTARVRASSPLRFLAIARGEFRGLLESEPRIAVRLLEVLAVRLAATMSR